MCPYMAFYGCTAPTSATLEANIIDHLSLCIVKLKCLMMLAPIIGFIGAVEGTEGKQNHTITYPGNLFKCAKKLCKVQLAC